MDPEVSSDLGLWLLVAAVPLVLAAATAFAKVTVVLTALRTGLGAQLLLPVGVVLALGLVVTGVIMAPTGVEVATAVGDVGGPRTLLDADLATWREVATPLLSFLERHASADELEYFAELQGQPTGHPLVLVPAFLVTELTEALTMAVLLIVPFVLVDLVVAQVLVLLSMPQVSVGTVALVPKILLFLFAGGWDVVLGGIVEGYL